LKQYLYPSRPEVKSTGKFNAGLSGEGGPFDGIASIYPVKVLLVPSCYRNQDKLWL